MTQSQKMRKALEEKVISKLLIDGFIGEYPDYRKVYSDRIELISFPKYKHGNAFYVLASVAYPNREKEKQNIDYNYFNIAVGILENEDIENQIVDYKTKLTQNKIDCNIYFYYLTQEQYEKYKDQFVVVDAGFVNYQMCIVENGKITTEIRYE